MQFNQDQIDSLVRKVLAIVGGILATHGATAASTTVTSSSVEELIVGLIMCGITFYASHKSNATQPVNTTSVEVTPTITTEKITTPTAPTLAAPTLASMEVPVTQHPVLPS